MPDINLDRYIGEADVLGTWHLEESTLALARRTGYTPASGTVHQITFLPDGTCYFTSITYFARKVEYSATTGTWQLVHDAEFQGRPKGLKNKLTMTTAGMGWTLYFADDNNRITIWNWWGDPDEWEFVKYRKRG